MANNLFLAVLLGATQAILLNLGKGLQKNAFMGEEELSKKKKRINQLLWVFGTILIVISTFVLMQAEIFGYLSVIASMTGLGIMSVTLYSYFILHEKIGKNELIGICLIITGTFIVPLFSGISLGVGISYTGMLFYAIILIAICFIIGLISTRQKKSIFGISFGIISGIVGGLSVVFQYSAMRFIPGEDLFTNFGIVILLFPANLFFLFFVIGGALEFLITQYAFTNGRAVEVVPANQSFFIIVPIIGGIIIFGEIFNAFQIFGSILVIIGVILCTAFKESVEDGNGAAGSVQKELN
ncbi:MAG: hypothetical protein ACTSRW_14740 [Candidatus Helarchaeota archaeon]